MSSYNGSNSSSDQSIDFENLPEDRMERFEILGIDPCILECGEEEIIMVTEASAIEELMKHQAERQEVRAKKL